MTYSKLHSTVSVSFHHHLSWLVLSFWSWRFRSSALPSVAATRTSILSGLGFVAPQRYNSGGNACWIIRGYYIQIDPKRYSLKRNDFPAFLQKLNIHTHEGLPRKNSLGSSIYSKETQVTGLQIIQHNWHSWRFMNSWFYLHIFGRNYRVGGFFSCCKCAIISICA